LFFTFKDRLTVQEKEREEAKQRQQEREAKQVCHNLFNVKASFCCKREIFKMAELRRRDTLRMVEESVRQETAERKINANDPAGIV